MPLAVQNGNSQVLGNPVEAEMTLDIGSIRYWSLTRALFSYLLENIYKEFNKRGVAT